MKVKGFKTGELSKRGSASLNVEVTADIEGLWTLEELSRLVDRMRQMDEKVSEEAEKLEGA